MAIRKSRQKSPGLGKGDCVAKEPSGFPLAKIQLAGVGLKRD